jgi:hypothetical protein
MEPKRKQYFQKKSTVRGYHHWLCYDAGLPPILTVHPIADDFSLVAFAEYWKLRAAKLRKCKDIIVEVIIIVLMESKSIP